MKVRNRLCENVPSSSIELYQLSLSLSLDRLKFHSVDGYWPRAIGSISKMDLRLFEKKERRFFSIGLTTRNFGIDRAILFSFCFFSFSLTLQCRGSSLNFQAFLRFVIKYTYIHIYIYTHKLEFDDDRIRFQLGGTFSQFP